MGTTVNTPDLLRAWLDSHPGWEIVDSITLDNVTAVTACGDDRRLHLVADHRQLGAFIAGDGRDLSSALQQFLRRNGDN